MDEAKRKGIKIDLEKLSEILGVHVVGTEAHQKKSVKRLIQGFGKRIRKRGQSFCL